MATQGPVPNEKKGTAPRHMPAWIWIWLWVLISWNVMAFFAQQSARQHPIAYSTFLGQVQANNVSRVQIVGDQISGTFVKAFAPPASPAETAASPKPHAQATPAPARFTAFETTFPETVGDPGLVALLRSHKVLIDVSTPSTPWWATLLVSWLPLLLLVGVFVWMIAAGRKGAAGMFGGFGKINAKRYTSDHPAVTFKDVAGADAAKAELQEEVDFLRHPKKYRDLGARIPRGILLVGPPGTGKTLMARAVAGEAGVAFFSLTGSDFVEMFVGVGASRVRDLFTQAKASAPAIVFIDELDAVGRRRGAGVGATNDEREQTLNQLLGELDGFDERLDVIVLAATNRPDVLDPALLRPGRFDRQVTVELPDRQGRQGILQIHAAKLRLFTDVDLASLASTTIGLSGADLANLCNEAALAAARHEHASVTMSDFEEALDRVRLGAAHPHFADPDERRVIAYHEAGHTIVAWFSPNADPVRKVTIIQHGQALGLTEQIPVEERQNLSLAYLKSRLTVLLAGRTAEELVFGEITTGAEQDLVEATSLARRMVTRWGMGELGAVAFKTDEEQPFLGYEIAQGRDYSETMAARIDDNVMLLLEEAHRGARQYLNAAREHLNRLADALLKTETVLDEDLARILGPRLSGRTELTTTVSNGAAAAISVNPAK